MKIKYALLLNIILIGLTFILTRHYFPRKVNNEIHTIDTLWKYDTINKIIYIDSIVPKEEIPPDTNIVLPQNCDSIKLLYLNLYRDHYTKKNYIIDFPIDTMNISGKFTLWQSVEGNSLKNVSFGYNLTTKIPTVTHTVFKNNWYIYGQTNFNSISLGVGRTVKNCLITATYNPIEKQVMVGIGYNIKNLKNLW